MSLALQTLKPVPSSLLHTQYHSLTAYKLGADLKIKLIKVASVSIPNRTSTRIHRTSSARCSPSRRGTRCPRTGRSAA